MNLRALSVIAPMGATTIFVLAGPVASAQPSPPSPPACDEWKVEYALSGSLQLSDTPMGQGDGIYPIGPGTLVLRFDDHGGQPGGAVKMLAYEMKQAFTVTSKTLFWKTSIVNDAVTRGTLDPCGPAEATLAGTALTWTGPVRSFVTEGTLTCEGAFCGSFGAPPPGHSALHVGPSPVQFKPFQYSSDMKTFTMSSTFVASTDSPKQTSHLALSGREIHRTCEPKACAR